MTGATVTRVATGQVCITTLAFTPNNVQASLSTGAGITEANKGNVVLAGINSQVAAPFACTGVWLSVVVNGAVTDGWSVYLLFQ